MMTAAGHALQLAHLRRPAIYRYASQGLPTWLPVVSPFTAGSRLIGSALAVAIFGFGAVFMSTFPGTRVGSAAARQHAGGHSLRRAIATSRANANSIVGRHFRPNHTEQRAIAGPRAFNGLCDDEGVPLICPTCQVLAQSVLAGDRMLLCMGLFSIFLVGSHRDAAARYPASATSKVAATRSRRAGLLVGTTPRQRQSR